MSVSIQLASSEPQQDQPRSNAFNGTITNGNTNNNINNNNNSENGRFVQPSKINSVNKSNHHQSSGRILSPVTNGLTAASGRHQTASRKRTISNSSNNSFKGEFSQFIINIFDDETFPRN
jgi:hypothetical protein